ncbi:DNA ligase [Bradyrhizobium sp. CCGUVB23]|uniref:ATP-dependent DNA ligase n=1 Tax=Bradyrhizobium sp. CCGUVB23 TaxID=2949630 RepID=UPI003531FE0D
MRLLSRNDSDWTERYPWIAEAALKNRQKHFVIDGEAVILGVDGIPDFNALHSLKHDHEVQLYAFDILAMDGGDLRELPLHLRKSKLERLLARRPDGALRAWRDRPRLVPGCRMGLEDLVSKHRDRALSRWPSEALDQGQEPQSSCDGARAMSPTDFG